MNTSTLRSASWHDAQYNNRARVREFAAILQRWSQTSDAARNSTPCVLDVRYGPGIGETLDIFPGRRPASPVLVYIHGGYWRALDKREQSFIAPPFVQAGAMVVLPNYALAPAVSIEHIVMQQVQALAWVHRNAARYGGDPGHIVVAGHSAGGHLAAMMLACRWHDVAADLPARLVRSALSLSGVFELEPLRHAPFLAPDLKLTPASARKLSPALMPAPRGTLVALVGAEESEEFQRQNLLIAQAWGPAVVPVCETVPARHHMNVLHDLAEPTARVHAHALRLLGLRV